jgi:hypothetical protein
MNKYRTNYTPEPPEPSTLVIYIGAAAMLVVLYVITIVLFTI